MIAPREGYVRFSYTTKDEHGNTVHHTKVATSWENADTLMARGIDRYGWRDCDWSHAVEYCYCGHLEDRHGHGNGSECWGCRDDDHATAPMTHLFVGSGQWDWEGGQDA